jgi:hypothetical protein
MIGWLVIDESYMLPHHSKAIAIEVSPPPINNTPSAYTSQPLAHIRRSLATLVAERGPVRCK